MVGLTQLGLSPTGSVINLYGLRLILAKEGCIDGVFFKVFAEFSDRAGGFTHNRIFIVPFGKQTMNKRVFSWTT